MKHNKGEKGQGLAEYAIIIALVALVAVIVLGLVGLALARSYGILGGVLGAQVLGNSDTSSSNYFGFDPDQLPRCGTISVGGGATVFYGQIWINPHIPISEITIGTDNGTQIDINPNATTNLYNLQRVILNSKNNGVCPHSIVVQTSKAYGGITLVSPVEINDWP